MLTFIFAKEVLFLSGSVCWFVRLFAELLRKLRKNCHKILKEVCFQKKNSWLDFGAIRACVGLWVQWRSQKISVVTRHRKHQRARSHNICKISPLKKSHFIFRAFYTLLNTPKSLASNVAGRHRGPKRKLRAGYRPPSLKRTSHVAMCFIV